MKNKAYADLWSPTGWGEDKVVSHLPFKNLKYNQN